MPWSNTETLGPIDWSNRTTNSYYTFNLRTGVSVEMQVNLCNTLGTSPWFNIPYQASESNFCFNHLTQFVCKYEYIFSKAALYITNWATYVRDNLRPDVMIYIEQGNECWVR